MKICIKITTIQEYEWLIHSSWVSFKPKIITNLKISNKNLDIIYAEKQGSELRNHLLEQITDWIFWIEPYDELVTEIPELPTNPACFYVDLYQNDVLYKEIKIWHSNLNLRYIYPTQEAIIYDNATYLENLILISKPKPINIQEIENWKKLFPNAAEPYYYEAFYHLSKNNFDQFNLLANEFLFRSSDEDESTIMTNYYLALIEHHLGKTTAAVKRLIKCIILKPQMAEFWCALGDIYYKFYDFKKSQAFYENAIILGSRKLKKDRFPTDIKKYKLYPEKMLQKIASNSLTTTVT